MQIALTLGNIVHLCQPSTIVIIKLYDVTCKLKDPIFNTLKNKNSVLTYGSEVWGFGDLSSIEKVHTDFMKYILKVKQSTPHIMLYGELGRFPLYLIIRKRTIKFWSNLM